MARYATQSLLTTLGIISSYQVQAASISAFGDAGVSAEVKIDGTPNQDTHRALKAPLNLTLEGIVSDTVSVFFNLNYGGGSDSCGGRSLGNSAAETPYNLGCIAYSGSSQPLSIPLFEKDQTQEDSFSKYVGYAYFSWASDWGVIKAGRLPLHWGLGLWRNSAWSIDSPMYTTADALSLTLKLPSTNISITGRYEKYAEGDTQASGGESEAYTAEVLVGGRDDDPSAVSLNRTLGVAFSTFKREGDNSTDLIFVDVFGRFRVGNLQIEGEVLSSSDSTKEKALLSAMGGKVCYAADGSDCANESSTVQGIAAVAKISYLLGDASTELPGGISAFSAAKNRLPSKQRPESHIVDLELGFASGDSDQFLNKDEASQALADNDAKGSFLHPNKRPSLLMFGKTNGLRANPDERTGMPGAVLSNLWYTKLSYTYESGSWGELMPSAIIGMLHKKNDVEEAQLNNTTGYGYSGGFVGLHAEKHIPSKQAEDE